MPRNTVLPRQRGNSDKQAVHLSAAETVWRNGSKPGTAGEVIHEVLAACAARYVRTDTDGRGSVGRVMPDMSGWTGNTLETRYR